MRDLATTGCGDSGTEIASWGVSEKRPRNDGKGVAFLSFRAQQGFLRPFTAFKVT
ncbi:MAG: hypothetical protein FWG98_15550 [Candidatus Cloacimonetes bacterium]|nr:hypothetical protein [Candidatus Cloacimonadota bacterium]